MSSKLTTDDHSRDSGGLKYIYPVLSRRSGGVSIGINVNTNNACNWRCVYCQVPELRRGSAPDVDWVLLEDELSGFLEHVQNGDFYDRFTVHKAQRSIKDIAISGNGEPTSIKQFDQLISLVGDCINNAQFAEQPDYVLISNGSLVHKKTVQSGLQLLKQYNGQMWFKLDSATAEGRRGINNAAITQQNMLNNLVTAAKLCPTWIQTCVFSIARQAWSAQHSQAYLSFLQQVQRQVKIEGVLLYTLARPSTQPEADQLKAYSAHQLHVLADQIMQLGIAVKVSV